jgi:ABC-type bacteriocin/lantibiotic exporter with double-glycine peptidase domain
VKDASWVILEAWRGGRVEVEGAGGRQTLPIRALPVLATGRALDLAPSLPAGETLWARLKGLFLQQRRALLLALAATLALQALALATPAVTAVILDRALPDGATSLLWLVAAGMLLATLHQAWIGWIRDRLVLFVATRVEAAAERGFLEHVLRCPFPFLQGRTLGDLMQAFAGFTTARNLLPMKTVGVLFDGGLAFVYLAMMSAILPVPTLLIILVTFLLALATIGVGRVEAGLEAKQVEAQAREHGLLIELIAGITTLKGAGAEGRGLARWQRSYHKVLFLELTRERIHLWAGLGTGMLGQGLSIALLIWGGHCLLAGTLSVGKLFAFLQASSGFMGAVLGMTQVVLTLMILRPQLSKAQEILAQEPEPRTPRHSPSGAPFTVTMEKVWFRYSPSAPWVLQDYDLRVEAGGKLALEGPSGFGKTTVLRLLAGLHVPAKGIIRLNGRSPREERGNILYLPQFVQLFGGSILDNLRIFSCGASQEKLRESAERTGFGDLVAALPMGYQTLLPPGGRNLSGGQRQLLVLTGALASGRPLLLLDEALANLDARSAATIQGLVSEGAWTVVAVNHALTEMGWA